MDNNINNHNHSMDIYQVEKVEKHQQKLLEQNLTFIEKVAKIETQQTTNTEQLVKLEQQMGSMKDTLIEEIHASVGSFTQLLVQQQDAQNKIIAIQSRQGEQIDEIRKTLDEFTKIQDVVTDHTFRIANLEKQMAKIDELDRAKVTGRWGFITAIVAGIVSVIGIVLGCILK